MKNMKNNLFENEQLIHKRYKRSRLLVLGVLCFIIFTMTVGYSANLSSILYMLGYVDLDVEEGDLEITSIVFKSSTNATDNGTSMSFQEDESTKKTILVANFNIGFYRSLGSSTTSATYEVVIYNGTFRNQTLSVVNSTATFTSGTSTLNYSLNGVNTGTTVLAPGESVTVTLTFSLAESSRNVQYVVDEVFEFEFLADAVSNIKLTPFLDTTSVIFNNNNDLKKVSVYVVNNSDLAVTYNFSTSNTNFLFVDSNGNVLSDFTIDAGVSSTVEIYLKMADEHIFISTSDSVKIDLNTTSPSILTYSFGTINVTVPESGSYLVLENKTIVDDSTIDFTSVASVSGIFKNSTSGEITYFYRGNVSDNYVSFAGYTWRIIRIDKYGTRLILDSVIETKAAWASSNTVSDLTQAMNVLSYSNSSVKPVLDSWYDTNLSSYSDIIKTSLFCEDMSYQSLTSSGSGYTTYYFGSYIRNGPDSAGYTPEFICDDQYTKEYNIGLLSGDEIGFAGALFASSNTNYYLYNSSITDYWWTISPSYYDTTLSTVGVLVVNGQDGKFHDWQNGSTIANENSIRPVITVDTDRLSGGSGLSSDPYVFS